MTGVTGSIGKPDIVEIPLSSPHFGSKVERFLCLNGLRLEDVDCYLAILDEEENILAGGGLKGDIIKCVAVSSEARSAGLALPLVSALVSKASESGHANLKVFTKPENEGIFTSLGFHTIASAPMAILMENGRGLESYLSTLRSASGSQGSVPTPSVPIDHFGPDSAPIGPLGHLDPSGTIDPYGAASVPIDSLDPSGTIYSQGSVPGPEGRTGVIVMNANPFTLGHEYLVRTASKSVDRLFVIPVKEDVSIFSYEERKAMIAAGCGKFARVLEGSDYQISAATFPTYFLKDLSEASETQMRLDLDLFARQIAPALGVSVRFVGTETSDPLTARYNALMKEILPAHGIEVVEIPRLTYFYGMDETVGAGPASAGSAKAGPVSVGSVRVGPVSEGPVSVASSDAGSVSEGPVSAGSFGAGSPSVHGEVHPRFAAAEYRLGPAAEPAVNAPVISTPDDAPGPVSPVHGSVEGPSPAAPEPCRRTVPEPVSPVPEPVEGVEVTSSEEKAAVSASLVREFLTEGHFKKAAALTPASTWPYLVAALMARALRAELDAPHKPGLVGPDGPGAHFDMDYDLMKGSIEVIRRSFIRHLIDGRNSKVADNQSNKIASVSQKGQGPLLSELIMNNLEKTALDDSSDQCGRGAQLIDNQLINHLDPLKKSDVASHNKLNSSNLGATKDSCHAIRAFGRAVEADLLAFTGGVNTHRGAIFSLGLIALAFLKLNLRPEQCVGETAETKSQSRQCNVESSKAASRPLQRVSVDYQPVKQSGPFENARSRTSKALNIKPYSSPALLSRTIAALAAGIEPSEETNGSKAVKEYGVKGALKMARDGYRPLFEDWLPYYRSLRMSGSLVEVNSVETESSNLERGKTVGGESGYLEEGGEGCTVEDLSVQMTLLRIMSQLDDTCIIHRVGFDRAQDVKKEAGRVLEAMEKTAHGTIGKIGPESEEFPCQMAVEKAGPGPEGLSGQEAVEKTNSEPEESPGHGGAEKTGLEFLREFKRVCDTEGISPGGAADMLAATIFIDTLIY